MEYGTGPSTHNAQVLFFAKNALLRRALSERATIPRPPRNNASSTTKGRGDTVTTHRPRFELCPGPCCLEERDCFKGKGRGKSIPRTGAKLGRGTPIFNAASRPLRASRAMPRSKLASKLFFCLLAAGIVRPIGIKILTLDCENIGW